MSNISEIIKDHPHITNIYDKKGKKYRCSKWGINFILYYFDNKKVKDRFTFRTKEQIDNNFTLSKPI